MPRAVCTDPRWGAKANAEAVAKYQKAYHAVWRGMNKEAIRAREQAYYLRKKAEAADA